MQCGSDDYYDDDATDDDKNFIYWESILVLDVCDEIKKSQGVLLKIDLNYHPSTMTTPF